jgi:hypothetical protein
VKFSQSQSAVLLVAKDGQFFDYHDAARAGGNGKTLSTLVKKGLLTKNGYPDGSNDWSITDAGRAAINGGHVAKPDGRSDMAAAVDEMTTGATHGVQ